jgi:hypothetical protein
MITIIRAGYAVIQRGSRGRQVDDPPFYIPPETVKRYKDSVIAVPVFEKPKPVPADFRIIIKDDSGE